MSAKQIYFVTPQECVARLVGGTYGKTSNEWSPLLRCEHELKTMMAVPKAYHALERVYIMTAKPSYHFPNGNKSVISFNN